MSLAKRLLDRIQGDRKQLTIAEWEEDDGSPFIIYYGPFRAIDHERVNRKHPGYIQDVSMQGMAEVIIMKAEDKDGNKLFTLDDKKFLMDHPATMITRIGSALLSYESIEEKEKN